MITVLSLFSGSGGLDKGAQDSGMRIVEAHEWDKDACEGYERFIGHSIQQTDLKRKDPRTFPNADVIVGGPPCQEFSFGNARGSIDGDKNLWPATLEIVKTKRPAMFVFENVRGLVYLQKNRVFFHHILDTLTSFGYRVEYRVLSAADYGVPQTRERVFIVGRLDSKAWRWPSPTHAKKPNMFQSQWVSWKSVLSDEWASQAQAKPLPSWSSRDQYQAIPNTALVNMKDQFKTRLHRDAHEPSMTVATESEQRFRIVINGVSYAADSDFISALQTFPSMGLSSKILGNAVPPMLAQAVFGAMDHV